MKNNNVHLSLFPSVLTFYHLFPLLCSSTLSVSVHLHCNLPLVACVWVCVCVHAHVCPHVLSALSVCSQLIKTQCQLSCFLPACLSGVCSSGHQLPAHPHPHPLTPLLYFTSPPLSPISLIKKGPIISPLCALDMELLPSPRSLLLISKLKTSHCQTRPQPSHALLEKHSGCENSPYLKSQP